MSLLYNLNVRFFMCPPPHFMVFVSSDNFYDPHFSQAAWRSLWPQFGRVLVIWRILGSIFWIRLMKLFLRVWMRYIGPLICIHVWVYILLNTYVRLSSQTTHLPFIHLSLVYFTYLYFNFYLNIFYDSSSRIIYIHDFHNFVNKML